MVKNCKNLHGKTIITRSMRRNSMILLLILSECILSAKMFGQGLPTQNDQHYRNVIRYDLSGGLLLGIDRYIVFGYERIVNRKESFSINAGLVSLPRSSRSGVVTDSFSFKNDP